MAIAYDTAGAGFFDNSQAVSSGSFSHTISTGNPFLWVWLESQNFSGGPPTVTSVTANSISLTKLDALSNSAIGTFFNVEAWYLAAPPTGSVTIAFSWSGTATNLYAISESYIGAHQSTPIDNHQITSDTSETSSTFNNTLTVGTANCWLVGGVVGLDNTHVISSSNTQRTTYSIGTGGYGNISDSGGTVGTGSQTLTWTTTANNFWMASPIFSLVPAPTGPIVTLMPQILL